MLCYAMLCYAKAGDWVSFKVWESDSGNDDFAGSAGFNVPQAHSIA